MPSAQKAGNHRELRFEAVGVTDVGRQRKHNEDHVLLRPELDLFAVADGMGGHNAGDIASRLATTSLRNFYEATESAPFPEEVLSSDYDDLAADARRLAAAIRKANRDVFEISSTYRQHHGMGSTVVAAYLERASGYMHVGHVGDSRCYRMRRGVLELLTHDHSLVNDALALKPDLTTEELARLPKNIITRALGMRDEVKVDIRSEETNAGDIFLLCSDGLSGMINEDEISKVLDNSTDLRNACELLVTMANDAGGTDNITALLVRIQGEDESAEVGAAASSARDPEVFMGMPSAETAPLSALTDSQMRSSLEAGQEVTLGQSYADTFVEPGNALDEEHEEDAHLESEPTPLEPVRLIPERLVPERRPARPAVNGGRPVSTEPLSTKPLSNRSSEPAPSLELDLGDTELRITTELRSTNPPQEDEGACPTCGADIEPGNLFCVECGARVDGS